MKTLYIDCGMGAAGDMLAAALLELIDEKQNFIDELNALGIPHVEFKADSSVKCGIRGTHMSVLVHGHEEDDCHREHHGHSSLCDIEHIIGRLPLPQKVRDDIMAIYRLIAEAESHVHGQPVTEIHFHEVGSMDAIADITAVCLLMDRLKADRVIVSPVHVGCGQVRCAHGILPVPAPATAHILRDVPVYGGTVRAELCTPTGAALLKHFACSFGDMPVMKVSRIGYGMGKKDFEQANCVRAMLGVEEDSTDEVWELCCNLDDMSGEAIGFAMEMIFEAGALDVCSQSLIMKKSRPGILLRVLCGDDKKAAVLESIFRHTSTIGIREYKCRRHVLQRRIETVDSPYGPVRCKVSAGYGVERRKYEYDDLSRIAKENGLSIDGVLSLLN